MSHREPPKRLLVAGGHVEDLVGQFVVVTGSLQCIQEMRQEYTPFGASNQPTGEIDYRVDLCGDGVPLYVRAVAIPWIAVEHPNRGLQTLDLRRIQVAVVNEEYARTVVGARDLTSWLEGRAKERAKSIAAKQPKSPEDSLAEGRCPNCGANLNSVTAYPNPHTHTVSYLLGCQNCGWTDGDSPVVNA